MMIRVVMFSAIFFAAASVPAAAETGDNGGRLVIGQGANSCSKLRYQRFSPVVALAFALLLSCGVAASAIASARALAKQL